MVVVTQLSRTWNARACYEPPEMYEGVPELFDNNEQAERVRESAKSGKQGAAQLQPQSKHVRRMLVLTVIHPVLPACYADCECVLKLRQKGAVRCLSKSGKVGEDTQKRPKEAANQQRDCQNLVTAPAGSFHHQNLSNNWIQSHRNYGRNEEQHSCRHHAWHIRWKSWKKTSVKIYKGKLTGVPSLRKLLMWNGDKICSREAKVPSLAINILMLYF